MSVSVTFNANAVVANLKKLANNAAGAEQLTINDVLYEILRLSQFEVPHDVGMLQDSGVVDEKSRSVGYNMVYAARLHEHPEYRFQKGRKGKYLEDPIKRNADVLGLRYGKKMQKELFKHV